MNSRWARAVRERIPFTRSLEDASTTSCLSLACFAVAVFLDLRLSMPGAVAAMAAAAAAMGVVACVKAASVRVVWLSAEELLSVRVVWLSAEELLQARLPRERADPGVRVDLFGISTCGNSASL